MRFRHILPAAALALVLGSGSVVPALAAASAWVGDAHAAVRLVTGSDSVAGGSVVAGLEFRFAPGWHGYWRTPGDAGLPPAIDWAGSTNVGPAAVSWPAPTRLVVEGLQNSVYSGDVVLPVALAQTEPGKPVALQASIGYAACSKVCVPFQAVLALALPLGDGRPSVEAPTLAAAAARVPGPPAGAGITVVATSMGGDAAGPVLDIDLRSEGAPFATPDLFVEGVGDGLPAAPEITRRDGDRAIRLAVRLPVRPERPLDLTFTDGDRAAAWTVPVDLPPARPPQPALRWWSILASALLGGLLLNLMPCVLPVLSIKLFGLTRHAGAPRGAVRLGFVATALGIVASFLLLAAVLSGLHWSGATLGWGIQFQQPWFLAGMAVLTVLFAASLFDWLPIGLPSSVMTLADTRPRHALAEAFLTGVFATLLATPCSAPFVGTAVGFALARGPGEIFAIFLVLGTGMALPYVAASAFPGVVRFLPRPGPWMVVLRQGLGLLLLGTALWLLFVLWSVAGTAVAVAVGALLAALLAYRALVTLGPWPGLVRRRGLVTAILAIAPLGLAFMAVLSPEPPAGLAADADWQAFDADAVPGLVAQGKTVLVDVSASWCLTCKVNDLAALERPEVRTRLDRPDTVRMRADWSRPNPSIAAYLHGFGRYGIPLDVVYGPRSRAGDPLPELLTPALVVDALDRAAPSPSLATSDR